MVICQLLSDIHLEFYDGRPGKSRCKVIDDIISKSKGNGAKYLFLAGDIANNVKSLEGFLKKCISEGEWEKIFYVPGNHEYYGKDKNLPVATFNYRNIKVDNVHCLHHNVIELPEIIVMGATLWSVLSPSIFENMNDSRKIRYNYKKVTLHQIINMHDIDVNYINNTLNDYIKSENNKKILCMTHHAPSYSLKEENDDDDNSDNSGYYSICDNLIMKSNYWLYGHTHIPMNKELYGCKMYNNPYGYPKELKDKNINFTFNID